MSGYPEHEKLKAVKDRSQAIGEFIEWLEESKRMCICYREEGGYWPTGTPINKLLAEHFEIDLDRLEDEKRQMLREQRALNAKHGL
jgi:hypothetical protein